MGAKVNQFERAYRAWPVLTDRAAQRRTITYGELADHLHIHWRPIRYALGEIQDRCLDEKKPPLTILVVNQRGIPGEGFIAWDVNNLEEGFQQVYAYPWREWPNPFAFASDGSTPEGLAERLVNKPEEAEAIYGRMQNRGMAQIMFRLALLDAYGGRCAFCGLSIVEALQAAHIIPWSNASPADRVALSNGLLLCSTHHALFDANIVTVDKDCKIVCRQDWLPGHKWTQSDRQAALVLHGQPITTPVDARLCPSGTSLAYRAARRRA